MEVILRESIPSVGQAGEIVKVKNGYARNYLIPRGLAYVATASNKRRVEADAVNRAQRADANLADAQVLAVRLGTVSIDFTMKAGEGDKLFGSVTSADIAEQLATLGYSIDKRVIELEDPIKMIGNYRVPIRLHHDVRAEIEARIVKEEQ
jgi:large subunit ribosomal protein L9